MCEALSSIANDEQNKKCGAHIIHYHALHH